MEMAHLQYMPGDPRLVDQLVYELKSKGIFDQFRKECIADVDTRPAYQNLRQRVESSVSTFLGRQCWQPDLNKNQLREKLRKHILDGNYLEQGVERIVDQVVNPKVASVFIPQVEDLVYNYLGISRKKAAPATETANEKPSTEDLLPTDLEAVSPGSVKSTNDKNDDMDTDLQEEIKMDVEETKDIKEDSVTVDDKLNIDEVMALTEPILTPEPDMDIDKKDIPLPSEDIKLENIPAPENSPPKADNDKIELHKIELPKEPNVAKEIAAPEEIPLPMDRKDSFKPLNLQSDDESSSDSSLRRNMSPLTPIRNYNNENSCDAQQAFDNDSDTKSDEKKEPSTFRFTIDAKSAENSQDGKPEKKDEQVNLSYQFNNQVNITTFNTPMSDDSSNSNNLHIDYESDANSKMIEKVPEVDQNSEDSKKEKKPEDKKSSHKSSHRSRDSHRHSSSKDKRSDSKQSTSRDSSRQDRKSKDERSSSKSKSSHRDKSKDRSEKKDSRDSSRHRTSHKSSSQKDSKSHRSSSSSQKHITKHDDKKSSSSSHRDKNDKSSDKSSKDKEKDKDRRDSKSSSSRSEKDRKGSSSSSKSKTDDKDKKKEKKDNDDHYSLSGRGNPSRRSTDRDSNDGSSSSKGSHNPSNSKSSETKKETKNSNSKSDNTSPSGDSTSPSDKDLVIDNIQGTKSTLQPVRVENHLEVPIASPPRLPFVPDVTLKKPKFAANLKEAKQMMKMRKFLDEEQKRMNQEAALLLEFQANVRPSLSQVYSSIPGPELEFACGSSEVSTHVPIQVQITPEIVIGPVQSNINVIQNIEPGNSVQDITIEDKKSIVSDVDTAHTSLEKETGGLENLNESITEDGGEGTYSENKPFSKLVEEITQYSKASERNKQTDAQTLPVEEIVNEDKTNLPDVAVVTVDDVSGNEKVDDVTELRNESNEANIEIQEKAEIESKIEETLDAEMPTTESKNAVNTLPTSETSIETPSITQTTENIDNPDELHYFAEHEKYDAEIKRHQYTTFLKAYIEKTPISSKIYLFNCDTYEENLIKEASESYGRYEIINYYRNGRLKLPKNVVKNVNLVTEITLPVDNFVKSPSRVDNYESRSPLFSPVKSECSFDLSSDYDAKLEEMVNKTSRQEVMEIILGSVIDESDNPRIDYCTESSIDSDNSLKRKLDVETTVNNNRQVLVPKMRRLSESDQISSTTEKMERKNTKKTPLNTPTVTRSKYLGRAKRVGLSRPRRNLPNSPSSDQSVENYSQNPAPASAPASASTDKQRYHPSDLYKPKLHYLCRRNNIT